MVELEQLNEYRFYKLEPQFPERCHAEVENIYSKVIKTATPTKTCGGLLSLQMKDLSVNMLCKVCRATYDISRICNSCGREHLFEDITCDTCEPIVINITTWKVSIDECNKAIKKINRAFKQNIIPESEWRTSIKIQRDELTKCEKELEKIGWL